LEGLEMTISEPMIQPKIVCRDIWKVFGRRPEHVLAQLREYPMLDLTVFGSDYVAAVRGVNFEVMPGETFVVMGLSGSGKSTLLRCLSRLTEPTAGQVFVNGADVISMSEQELRELRRTTMSMVFQHFGLLPHRRVIDNVAYGLEVRGVPRKERYERALQMIELVGLTGWEQHLPRQLSGGMQQRVGLARALAGDPDILLYDEPFSALDPLIRREMQDELLRLQASLRKTSIFITHDFAEALRIGDRIAIMRNGQFVQVGTPQELVLNPRNEYVRAFVKDAPRAKVLTASTIMQPQAAVVRETSLHVQADTSIEDLLPLVQADDRALAVTNPAGDVIGFVDRQIVLSALVQPN
jgi:glycine betaine/proline transport system ATP-binding protein